MKIQDIMQTSVLSVSDDTLVKEVARVIFSTGSSGIPVVKNEKLVGIITEEDILSHLYPKQNASLAEKNIQSVLNSPIGKIMNKKVTSVNPDAKLLEAQSIMIKNKFSRLPVVNNSGELVGIVSEGDILIHLIKKESPKLEEEDYAGFIYNNYDDMVDWDKRFAFEFPSLFRVFERFNVKKILDLGVWTGEYSIELAKRGYEIIGLDHNPLMVRQSSDKLKTVPEEIRNRVKFLFSDFSDIPDIVTEKVDAVICMGNSFPYIPQDLEKVIMDAKKVLRKKNGVILLQILNMNRVIQGQRRLLSFNIKKFPKTKNNEHLSVEFFDEKDKNTIMHNVAIFDSNGKSWNYKGINSLEIKNITVEDVEKMLKKAGFKEISVSGYKGEYQGQYGQMSLIKPYDPLTSEWMTIFANT